MGVADGNYVPRLVHLSINLLMAVKRNRRMQEILWKSNEGDTLMNGFVVSVTDHKSHIDEGRAT